MNKGETESAGEKGRWVEEKTAGTDWEDRGDKQAKKGKLDPSSQESSQVLQLQSINTWESKLITPVVLKNYILGMKRLLIF